MLSFKNRTPVEPMYDYYVETDLDSFDQPVDYSKKYQEQDSYEECDSGDNKPMHFTSSQATADVHPIKQTYNDELKVYCMEGTPRTISSSSSFCDLRDIGASNDRSPLSGKIKGESFEKKPCLSASSDPDKNEDSQSGNIKENQTFVGVKDLSSEGFPKGKDVSKEGKTVTFCGDMNYVNETPLMFSRSSSICSLSSFEQQSIVDDRSSVSFLSTRTSGIISPSELPDSPSEVMTPGHQKTKSTVFEFPNCVNDKSKNDILSLHLKLKECDDYNKYDDISCKDIFDDTQKAYNEEGDFSQQINFTFNDYKFF